MNNIYRHALYFAPVLGALFIMHFVFGTSSNMLMLILVVLLKIIIPIVAVYFAIDCRRRVNDDLFTYWLAFRYFLLMFVGASLICSVFIFIYVQWINTDFLINLKEISSQLMERLTQTLSSSVISESEMEQIIDTAYTPKMFTASSFLSNLIIGFIITIIGSFIVRNKKQDSNDR